MCEVNKTSKRKLFFFLRECRFFWKQTRPTGSDVINIEFKCREPLETMKLDFNMPPVCCDTPSQCLFINKWARDLFPINQKHKTLNEWESTPTKRTLHHTCIHYLYNWTQKHKASRHHYWKKRGKMSHIREERTFWNHHRVVKESKPPAAALTTLHRWLSH